MSGRVTGSEGEAFQKLLRALESAQEAAAEIGVRRSDTRWGAISVMLNKTHQGVSKLFLGAEHRRVRGHEH